ncbi:hypothetical protein HBI56_179990 [Parastagonospora nodorum]|uniref:PNPLA domain-containing protein n=1 Tax=Phaeosphaeria nodorum (strain SN15 / ATCC MYA-4574 / FGSC 10173) TaxID=321614 RepID=A0A7U2FDP8_PHANO|nr:hypothetical protein HBH56_185420 [Parastagonospora nodorum]QRD01105.1 hypothetical protein JI435_153000 [Parastagonospora nodorum SN15]KAH3925259.1 hypothetical protein HBH54_183140 [Parastagonospora nodorum]KAH3940611.1 hypothetical protein HBH53_214700 [Parastagonospora nodorum]KAH3958270.1 hypothetical protein HBH51_211680 [Parastagonospora nodorum]
MDTSQRAVPLGVPISSSDESSHTSSHHNHDYPVPSQLSPDLAWSQQNLLSLDGGGIRGYWTLLVLQQLMICIAREESRQMNGSEEHHSFYPSQFPSNVTRGDYNDEEKEKRRLAPGHRAFTWACVRDARKFLPCHYFDYICGSSTGALIAIMLGRFRMPVWDCLQEYEKMSHLIFGKPRIISQRNIGIVQWPKFSATAMEKAFQDVTARRREQILRSTEDITFPSPQGICQTFVTTRGYERKKDAPVTVEKLYLLRTYVPGRRERLVSRSRQLTNSSTFNDERRNERSADNWQVWRVARAATAAPMYFTELAHRQDGISESGTVTYFSDGGFGAENNPTDEGITEIRSLHGLENLGAVVNVGTSRKKQQAGGKSFFKRVHNSFDRATDPDSVAAKVASMNLPYEWRFNDESGIDVELDEWKPNGYFSKSPGVKTLEKIKSKFNEWAADPENSAYLRRCARELVSRRRARIRNFAKWEIYATSASYMCEIGECRNRPIADRTTLETHLRSTHSVAESEIYSTVGAATKMWRYQIPHAEA